MANCPAFLQRGFAKNPEGVTVFSHWREPVDISASHFPQAPEWGRQLRPDGIAVEERYLL
jgi:hypothetical protein